MCKQLPPTRLQCHRVMTPRHSKAPLRTWLRCRAPCPAGSSPTQLTCGLSSRPWILFLRFVVHLLFKRVHNSNPRRQTPGQNSSKREPQAVGHSWVGRMQAHASELCSQRPGCVSGPGGLLRQAGRVSLLSFAFFFFLRKGQVRSDRIPSEQRVRSINLRLRLRMQLPAPPDERRYVAAPSEACSSRFAL